MHRVAINFGTARQTSRTTAMLAIFQSIIENLVRTNNDNTNHILYITRNSDTADNLTRLIQSPIIQSLSRHRQCKGAFSNTEFSIISGVMQPSIVNRGSNVKPPCKCKNCGFVENRKKTVVFLDGTTVHETFVRLAFPESEWDLDLYLAD